MSTPLMKTKLYTPGLRPGLVPRPRLIGQLNAGLHSKLTLVSAKAGAGKTTLVSEWLHQQERPSAWLSLDENDNHPQRFISYLVAALGQFKPEVGQSALGQLDAPSPPPAEDVIVDLVNDMASGMDPYILVLDDYHQIQNEWIHQAVGCLTGHQPPEMHLIFITRSDPPLPLARLRGRGQMAEIRDQDLRFTLEETDRLFNEVMKLDLSAEAISTLEGRTEGWIVGLQMAAISVRGHKIDGDPNAFIEMFGGTNRYILDYLMDEVLNQQTPEIRRFLIETSILQRMCGSLCDALIGRSTDPRGEPGESGLQPADRITISSQTILEQLERTNLFVIPLDDEREWYRYHHLFADLLNSILSNRRSAGEIRELHHLASLWHQNQGSLEEAMTHAMAAQDFERAATMIDDHIVRMLSRSEGPVLLGWIEKLPEQVVHHHPWIDINRAYTLALSGRPGEADSLLEVAESRIEPDSPRASELMGHIAAIRSYTANLWGDSGRVFEMAEQAEKYLPEEHLIARGMSAYAQAVTYFANDDMDRASIASLKMLKIGKKLDRLLMVLTALCDLASVNKVRGKLNHARKYYDRAHRWMVEKNGLDTRVRSAYEVGLADLLYQMNQLEASRVHAEMGVQYCQRFEVPSEWVTGYVTLMRVLQAQNDVDGAFDALREAEQIMQTYQLRLTAKILLKAARVKQWLAAGDTKTANQWASECDGGSELEQLALAHLLIAGGRPVDAQELLEKLRVSAKAGGRNGRLIEILGLQAIAQEAHGGALEAEKIMSQALSLARPERCVRVFLDLGEPFYKILARSAERSASVGRQGPGIARLNRGYLRNLLVAFRQEMKATGEAAPSSTPPSHGGEMIEPLTDREHEVLQLLAEGLSNKQIANRLVIAPSTVKQHLKNLYTKLDVHNRTRAVARGREQELL